MPEAAPTSASQPTEKTFRSYSQEQGKAYASHRRGYHDKLYEFVVQYHASSGGQFDTLVDIGCGPGLAIRDLAPQFTHAIGLDPSEGMVSTARSLGGVSSGSEPIRFEVSSAEELGSNLSPAIPDGSVDLLIAATAAHWFNMSAFFPRAAQILKPGGTVAIWTGGSVLIGPPTPNAEQIQAALDELEDQLEPYKEEGNRMVRNLYANLPLPWTLPTPVLEFDQESLMRKEWGTGDGAEPLDEFHAVSAPLPMEAMEKVLGTASPVTRWRAANPDLVNTESDIVRVMRRKVEKALHDGGVEEGKEVVTGGVRGVLLAFKKKAQ